MDSLFVVCYVFTDGTPVPDVECDEVRITTDNFIVSVYRGDNIPVLPGRRAPLSFFYTVAATRGTALGMTREKAISTVDGWLSSFSAVRPEMKMSMKSDVTINRKSLIDAKDKRDRIARYKD